MLTLKQTETFAAWLKDLRDLRAKRKIAGRLQMLKFGHFGDVGPAGQGLSELRVDEGKGYRVYFRQQNREIIFLLCGGDKKSQKRDIKQAHQIWKDLKNETRTQRLRSS